MLHNTSRLIVFSSLICFGSTGVGHAATPALLEGGENTLESLIVFPTMTEGTAVEVRCRAEVDQTGGIANNYCFDSENIDRKFVDAVNTAAKSANAIPAVVDGEPHWAILWYRVVFAKLAEESLIHVFPNWGIEAKKHGHSYIGPQRISRLMLPRVCGDRGILSTSSATSLRSGFSTAEVLLMASLTIDITGRPSDDLSFESASSIDDLQCRRAVGHRLKKAKFIPGFSDGVPIDATYVQPVGNYNDMSLR